MEEKYLPIGTVVTMKKDILMYVIAGYLHKNIYGKIIDYVCIPYPYGFMTTKAVKYFNHEDIDEVLMTGYKINKYDDLNKILNKKI